MSHSKVILGNHPVSYVIHVIVNILMSVICYSHMTVFMLNFALVTEGAVGCRLGTNYVTETGVEDIGGMTRWGTVPTHDKL